MKLLNGEKEKHLHFNPNKVTGGPFGCCGKRMKKLKS